MFSDLKEPFPLCKAKGNCTFIAQAVIVGSNEVEENPGAMQGGDGKTESSADEVAKKLGGVGGRDQSMGYINHFANVVKLYQQKNRSCFGCRSPNHLMWDCPKDISKTV